MKLAFKVGEGGNEEGVREIEDLADEDSADEEGDMEVEEEKKEEAEEAAKPGFLRRARNKCANGRRTVTGMIGTRMTNAEARTTLNNLIFLCFHTFCFHTSDNRLFPNFRLFAYFSVSILWNP